MGRYDRDLYRANHNKGHISEIGGAGNLYRTRTGLEQPLQ